MIVTDEHVAAVRAMVTGDDDTLDRLFDGADVDEDWEIAFMVLATGLFQAAVRYRFGGKADRLGIIRFVSRSRVRHGGDQAGFTPSAAEALMGFPLGLNPEPTGIGGAESYAMLRVLMKDLASDISFTDFESLIEAVRVEVNRRLPHEGEKVRALYRDLETGLS